MCTTHFMLMTWQNLSLAEMAQKLNVQADKNLSESPYTLLISA